MIARRLAAVFFLAAMTLPLVAAGCLKSLDDLAPFPCADDGTCPDGFGCNAGSCVKGAANTTCGVGCNTCLGQMFNCPAGDVFHCGAVTGGCCPPDFSFFCDYGPSPCWNEEVDCSTIVQCPSDSRYYACPSGTGKYDCNTMVCH